MAVDIIIIDGGVTIDDPVVDDVKSYPSGTTSLNFTSDHITSSSEISPKFKITSVSDVNSITDDRTGGAGAIAVPVTVRLIYDLINPFFFKVAASDSDTNIYNTDDSLTASRTVDLDGSDLAFNSSSGGSCSITTVSGGDVGNLSLSQDEFSCSVTNGTNGFDIIGGAGQYTITKAVGLGLFSLDFSNTAITIRDTINDRGIDGNSDYSANYAPLTYVQKIYVDSLGDLGEFTLAGLPAASATPNKHALVTDASGGRTIVRSDGTNWKIVAVEGATVS